MKIVVLDGHTLNPGDLNWRGLESLGELTVYDRTTEQDIVPRATGAAVVFTNKTPLTRKTLESLPGLKYIGVLATGYNVVDIRAARDLGIPVTNVPMYGTRSVAQMVFAHVLNFSRRVADHAQTVREGKWSTCDDFCYWDYPLAELDGQTMGIVGYGRIGKATAELALAFGMLVLVNNGKRQVPHTQPGVTATDLDTLFSKSDYVSLHCPLTRENAHMVDATCLAKMKPTAYLINTSRGPLVDEMALAAALKSGQLAGAGLDVLEKEPPEPDNPLIGLKNCYITPHIAWATRAARSRLMQTAVDNLQAFLDGQVRNVVSS